MLGDMVANAVFAADKAITKTKCAIYDVEDAISFAFPPKTKSSDIDLEEAAEEIGEELSEDCENTEEAHEK